MKILALGDEHGLHHALYELQNARLENIEIFAKNWIDFQLEQLSRFDFDVIVLLSLLPINASKQDQVTYRTFASQLILHAKSHNVPIMLLSSAAVFDGARIAYNENDQPCPNSEYGQLYADLEAYLLTEHQRCIIIRTGWLYSARKGSFLNHVVEFAEQNTCIRINSAAKANPTSIEDIARVFLAIILQLEQGAENWGIFHYVAADTALGFQFVEAVLQQASQYQTAIDPKQVCFEHQERSDTEFYFPAVVLKCKRLQGNFGIHQRAWRSLMPAEVRRYYGM